MMNKANALRAFVEAGADVNAQNQARPGLY
jgi:hypothetical protein